ncbi:MBL fold metallo-hydrolase [Candidatus Bathyarchaeota archaeon]|nr:MBL fold metallo-hydrolase [Candidatus Bathyarchaeota archaeon]
MMYLIWGSKRCLLIDTGCGIGDPSNFIASLSALPLIVMNSHGHPDHTYGNIFLSLYSQSRQTFC